MLVPAGLNHRPETLVVYHVLLSRCLTTQLPLTCVHREGRHVALKIVKSARHYTETAIDEIDLLKKVANTKPSAPGWNHVVQMYDSFKINGPHGTRILICCSWE